MNNIVTIIKGLLNNSISHLGTDDGYNKTKLIPAIIPTLPITSYQPLFPVPIPYLIL